MTIAKQPFRRYKLEGESRRDIFTCSMNKQDREMLNKAKLLMKQPKDSTALKQLAWLGSYVLHEHLTGKAIELIIENKRRAERIGITEFEG